MLAAPGNIKAWLKQRRQVFSLDGGNEPDWSVDDQGKNQPRWLTDEEKNIKRGRDIKEADENADSVCLERFSKKTSGPYLF